MSHRVVINYKQIAVQCNSVCDVAEKQLQTLDEMIARAEQNSSTLLNAQTKALAESIRKERDKLAAQISLVREHANDQSKRGRVKTDSDFKEYRERDAVIREANVLKGLSNTLASKKIVEFEGLLHNLLKENIEENYRTLVRRANGEFVIEQEVQRVLDDIPDETQRQYTLLAYMNDSSLCGDALILAGQALVGQTYEQRVEAERERIRAELEEARVDKATIEKVAANKVGDAKAQITAMREEATKEIVGEKVRQKSMKIIMQAIKARGFIVDKSNIKIKRDTNEVVMVALKASGEKAEFRIFLDGKFIYDFRGYEGQACQNDIQPFMKDLEEVYGVKVTNMQEIWSNPDKISTMKYQAMNTNKNRR